MSMDPVVAELILAEAEAARRSSLREVRRVLTLPLSALALLHVVAAPLVLVIGRDHLMPFFGLGFLAISVVAWARQRRLALAEGVRTSLVPWIVTVVSVLVGASAASRIGDVNDWAILNLAGPFAVTAAAIAVLSRWVRSRALGAVAVAMPAVSIAVVSVMSGDRAIAAQSLGYAVLLAIGCRRMAS